MKKLLIITLLFISFNTYSQTQATAANQQIQIGKEQLILNKLNAISDTSTMVFIKTIPLSVTYTAGRAVIGNSTVKSWSLDLGSQYWQLQDVKVFDMGGNYGLGTLLLILNDTLAAVDNVSLTPTATRNSKLMGMVSLNAAVGTATSGVSGRVNAYGNLTSGLSGFGVYTGVVYFLHIANTTNGSSGNTFTTRMLFRRVRYN